MMPVAFLTAIQNEPIRVSCDDWISKSIALSVFTFIFEHIMISLCDMSQKTSLDFQRSSFIVPVCCHSAVTSACVDDVLTSSLYVDVLPHQFILMLWWINTTIHRRISDLITHTTTWRRLRVRMIVFLI